MGGSRCFQKYSRKTPSQIPFSETAISSTFILFITSSRVIAPGRMISARSVLWQILASLADVEVACGEADASERLRDEARTVVADIAEHAGEMREMFLARPDVVSLLK
jgi:hypothetical protein